MVDVVNEGVIRVYSDMNEWMDCVFIVAADEAEKAKGVLTEAFDSYWEDGDGWCYGNYLEAKLVDANIAYRAYYAEDGE